MRRTTVLRAKTRRSFKKKTSKHALSKWRVFLALAKPRHLALAALVAVIIAANIFYLLNPRAVLGQTYLLTQSSWAGGVSASTVTAPSHLSDSTNYVSSSSVTAGAGSIALTSSQTSFSDSFTATTNEDVGNTTATWNTGTGRIEMNVSAGYSATDLYSSVNTGCSMTAVLASVYYPAGGDLYLGGDNGTFCKYHIATAAYTDLTAQISSFWGANEVFGLAYDSANGKIYLGGNSDMFAAYTPGGTATQLPSPAWGYNEDVRDPDTGDVIDQIWHPYEISRLVFSSVDAKIYLIGAGRADVYVPGGSLTDITTTITTGWSASPYIYSIAYDSVNSKLYYGGSAGRFTVYTPGGTATNLTAVLAGILTNNVQSLVFDSVNAKIYLGSDITPSGSPSFAVYTPGGTATNLTSNLSGWGNHTIYSMVFDAVNSKVYLGSENGMLYVYVIGGATTNLTSQISSFWGASQIYAMGFDPVNAAAYLMRSSGFASIAYTAGCSTCNAVSLGVDSTTQNIKSATLTKTDTPGTGTVTYYLSNNGGANYATVTPGSLYTFGTTGSDLRFKIALTGNATVSDIAIAYNFFPASGSLTSSKFDTGDATNVINRLLWAEDSSLPAGTTVTASIRTADTSTNLTGAWTDLTNASSGCSKSTGTVTCDASSLPAGMKDGSGDRWFQYKIALASTGADTPTVSSTSVEFIINAAPEVRNVTAVQNANGTVTIHYEVRDSDTASGAPTNQDHITPTFEYWNGTTYQTITTLAVGDTNTKAVAHDGSWNNVVYTATWTPTTDYSGHFQNNTAKIRVTADDGESANRYGTAESATYTLDTLDPETNTITVDASTATPTINLSSTDNSTLAMKVSATDPTLASTASEPYSATKTNLSLTEGATVYAKFIDAYGNSSNIISATIPVTPTAVIIQDNSNVIATPHVYRMFLAWKAVTGTFSSYKIYRSTTAGSPESWAELTSIGVQATNYYLDTSAVADTSYYYYIKTLDGLGNASFKSAIVNGVPNGFQDAGEGGGGSASAPVISSVSPGTPQSTQATITWDTDTLSNSLVEYSTSASTFSNSVAIGSLVDNAAGVGGHSVILSGLTPGRTYYYRVSSTDINDQTTTADNGGAGYSFLTPTGPIISAAAVEQTTNTTARVSWITNISATTQLVHSIHSDMAEPTVTTGTSDPTPTHTVSLANLTPATKYFFYIRSVDGSSNETTDKNIVDGAARYYTFTTTNDTAPPVISDISVRTQPTSADIIWTTNEAADSQVEYGLTSSYGTATTLDATATNRHVVTITGLTPQTAYSYRIRSRDVNAVLAVSGNQTLTTSQAGDATPPTITAVAVTSLSLNSASVNWTTDEPATSYIDYGLNTGLGSSFGNTDLTTRHSVTIDALAGATTYYFRVRSADAAGNETADTNGGNSYTFTTAADSTAPTILDPDDIILMNSFRVVWSTDELADSQIEYGLDASYGSTTTLDEALVLDHAVTVPSLAPATAYHYRIKTRDASDNLTTGPDRVITTAAQADHTPPVISAVVVSNISRTTATITWTTDEKSGSEVQYGPNATYGYSTVNTNDNTRSHSVALSGLTPGGSYYFKVISTDGSGNIGSDDHSGNGYTFTAIVDTEPPAITSVETSLVADTSAVVTWVTNEPATSQVVYGLSTQYGSQTAVDPTLSTVHSVTLSGLTVKTDYIYKVVSADAYSNSTTDDHTAVGYTFTTTAEPGKNVVARTPESDKTPPLIMNLRVGSIGKTSAIVEWNTDEPADTIVKYGKTIAYGTLAGSVDEKLSSHQVDLTGLVTGTIYHFIAVSSDAYGNQGTSTDRAFATLNADGTTVPLPPQPVETTPPAGAPLPPVVTEGGKPQEPSSPLQIMGMLDDILKNPNLAQLPEDAFVTTVNEMIDLVVHAPSIVGLVPRVDVTGTTATVSWVTDKKTTGLVAYAKDADYAPANKDPYTNISANTEEFAVKHAVTLENLEPATKYHFQVRSKGLVGSEARSADMSFVTTSELPVISDLKLTNVTDFDATISWTSNTPTNTQIVYSNSANNSSLTQGDTAYLRDHVFKIENLQAGVGYSLYINAEDAFGNKAVSHPISFVTSKDTTAPEISKVSSESTLYPGKESRVQTIISWDTNEPATSHVFYQEGLAPDAQVVDVPADSNMILRHTVVVTKFRPATVYKFWVESTDNSGNKTKSSDFLILTPQQKATVLDIIIGNFEQVFGWTNKLGK